MSQPPFLAIVIEGGMVQWLVAEAWPGHLPLPRIVIVDHDTDGVDDDAITTFTIGQETVRAVCSATTPAVAESYEEFLSPKAVLAALGEPVDGGPSPSPVLLTRELRSRIQALDGELDRNERPPTGDDYNRLHAIVNGWLIDILKALGDRPD